MTLVPSAVPQYEGISVDDHIGSVSQNAQLHIVTD